MKMSQTNLVLAVGLAAALPMLAIGQAGRTKPAHVYPPGSATDITKNELDTVLKRTAGQSINDQQVKTIDIDGQYQVGIGVLHRSKVQQSADQLGMGALEHAQITEVYHVLSGSGTLLTGGTLDNARESAPDSEIVTTLTGPSSTGRIRPGTGVSRRVGAGDIVVLPPNTPHVFSQVDDPEIVYAVVRMDPHYVLPKNYVNPGIKK
jgi:mannose-6-phosphate isomerase-like protein (cupin superfamily)